jgi:hypothetical protein
MADNKCFACGKKLGAKPALADTRDGQIVYVGRECIKKVIAAGEQGLPVTPWPNGVRLYPMPANDTN